jgi:hypothetical protein
MSSLDTLSQTTVSLEEIVAKDSERDVEITRFQARVEGSQKNFSAYGDTPQDALRTLADTIENNSVGLKGTALYENDT